ncbi:hypothetical protein EDD71_103130 [Fonticella tunisiensis]|uniref:Uncharacterized protein n=1 Tax=Fonticella tunisiensis TaxID=1096341 RepID=A0A4R7KTT3_9CLOT|nr:hypothetical protein EDD71_103130 [Fonticella tunisiensis]
MLATRILEKKLKLMLNKEKTHITSVDEGVAFPGFIYMV